jgi:hypothetical protein
MTRFWLLVSLLLFAVEVQAGFFGDAFESSGIEITSEPIAQEPDLDDSDFTLPVQKEKMVFSQEEETETEDENTRFVSSQSLFLSTVNSPKKVYLNQHFTLRIKAVATGREVHQIRSQFLDGKDYKIYNPKSPWKKVGDNSYLNQYEIKLLSKTAQMPAIKVFVEDKRGAVISEVLEPVALSLIALKKSEVFSGVVASALNIHSHHAKKYDDNSNIVLLEINATNANLEDFHLPFAIREGIDSLKKANHQQSIYYFATLPNYQKTLKIKYFNSQTNRFNILTLPILITDSSVSTQTNLNPQKSKYFFYKLVLLFTLMFILVLAYFKYKKPYLLIFAMLIALYTMYTKLLTHTLVIPKGIMIRILPTESSTIFLKTAQKTEAQLLLKKSGYSKVLLPSKQIGWIKDVDISKN